MAFHERVGNLHVHTTHSDGHATHAEVAGFAARAGLDFVVVTDHNVYDGERQGWHDHVLLLVGEELHDPEDAHHNHLLALGIDGELADTRPDPQARIDAANAAGGLAFLAHPVEHSGPLAGEPEIDWVRWDVSGYAGLEVWNHMSEFKAHLANWPITLLAAFFPKLVIRGPHPETLARWDALLARGPVYGIAGSDAHGTTYSLGPLRRQVLSYPYLFRALSTHVLLDDVWSGDVARDAGLVWGALRRGRAFMAYDGLAPTRGFTFVAEHAGTVHAMGETIDADGEVTLRITTPQRARLRLMQNGFPVGEATGTRLTHRTTAPGAYRVEAYRSYAFRQRAWILSNPIMVRTCAESPSGARPRGEG